MAYTKGTRYSVVPGSDNKYSMAHKEVYNPAYAANINVIAQSPESEKITVDCGTLTGALALTADVTQPYTGDEMICFFTADGSARTVTPGAGFIGAGAIVVAANKSANVNYVYQGKAGAWVETSRFIQS